MVQPEEETGHLPVLAITKPGVSEPANHPYFGLTVVVEAVVVLVVCGGGDGDDDDGGAWLWEIWAAAEVRHHSEPQCRRLPPQAAPEDLLVCWIAVWWSC